ncbi:MAG: type II secretion system protein N [Pseudomonadales bacterium]|nr:type II secretion system protein N [Pseudomonadales bacterium]
MSKKRVVLFVLAGVVFFIALLIKQLPANLVLAHAANQSRLFIPVQVSGTLWQGQAANIIINAGGMQFPLGEVKWELSAFSLLTGSLALNIDAQNGDQKISGFIDLGFDQSIEAEDLKMAVDATLFKSFLPMPINYQGFVELDLQRFSAANLASKTPEITELSGNLLVKDLAINFGAAIELGTYGVRLALAENQPEGDTLIALKITDIDAKVAVDGDVQLLAGKKDYYVDIKLKPKDGASPMITQTLGQFYKKQADGFFKVVLGKPL